MGKTTNKPLEVTPLEQLIQYSQGTVINLPAFAEDQPFVAKLRRPSILALAKAGKIPNALMTTANSLFIKGGVDTKDEGALREVFQVIDVLCEAAFVEPAYQQIKDSGIELTDEQYMFIFNYTQTGVRALEPFRKQS